MRPTELCDLLSWEADPEPVVAAIASRHIEARAGALATLAGASPEVGAAVADLASLVGSAVFEVLDAPETLHYIQSGREGDTASLATYLRNGIRAERLRTGEFPHLPSRAVTIGCWTAKGDQHFAPDGTHWSRERLDGALVIDTRSPAARRPIAASEFRDTTFAAPIPWDADTEAEAMDRIRGAWERLRRVAPEALSFVRASTRCLVVQQTPDGSDGFTSSSSRRFVGRTLLMNPTRPEVSQEKLVSALVHEAVHSYLYRLEHDQPIVSPGESLPGVVSPWSGATLRVHTYIHACFVYYAIVGLWRRELAATPTPTTAAQVEFDRALQGFKSDIYQIQLAPHRDRIRPDIAVEFARLGDKVRTLVADTVT